MRQGPGAPPRSGQGTCVERSDACGHGASPPFGGDPPKSGLAFTRYGEKQGSCRLSRGRHVPRVRSDHQPGGDRKSGRQRPASRLAADLSSVRPFGTARAVALHVQEKPTRADPDATAQLERPLAETNVAAPASRPAAMRRPVDRWSTVFTVFAAVALVALLLLGAAVISSQQIAAPSASPSTSPSPSSSVSPSISTTPAPRTVAPTPTEAPTNLTPVPTKTLPLTPVPTVVPSVPVTPLPTRT